MKDKLRKKIHREAIHYFYLPYSSLLIYRPTFIYPKQIELRNDQIRKTESIHIHQPLICNFQLRNYR